MTGNIYLIGFMGSGKTTVGRLLAEALNRKFVDMDSILEARFKQPIADVFASQGEEAFRRGETALLKRLAKRQRLVVATGGGLPERIENRKLMRRSGRIILLETDLDSCLARVGAKEAAARPLWRDKDSLRRLFERRKGAYADCDLSISTDGKRAEEVTEAAVAQLFSDSRLTVKLDAFDSPVVSSFNAPPLLHQAIGQRRTALITDRKVARLHLDRYRELLGDPLMIVVPGGERIKSLPSAKRVFEQLLENRFHRDSMIIALGGGAVTDLGAFVAATYMRGIDFALVSTSLLGCVDAAVGGKAAVNIGPAKNVVGCFTVPRQVILDVQALKTLDRKQIREGLVEAYKTGLVAAPKLAELIEREWRGLLAKDLPLLGEVVDLSARAKAEVVTDDFRESGRRRILNLGHTFGHAVEGWHKYRVSHGQAVASGLIAVAKLSLSRGLIDGQLYERIVSTVGLIAPRPVTPPPIEEAWQIMGHDKKIKQERIVFVLLKGVGQPVVVDDVDKKELAAALLV